MSESTEAIIDQFLHLVIAKVEDEPNYYSIKEIEKKLMQNAASIPIELGGGNHGFLDLVLTPQKIHYNNRASIHAPCKSRNLSNISPKSYPTYNCANINYIQRSFKGIEKTKFSN